MQFEGNARIFVDVEKVGLRKADWSSRNRLPFLNYLECMLLTFFLTATQLYQPVAYNGLRLLSEFLWLTKQSKN